MNDEEELMDLEELWHTSDSELPLTEFLGLTNEQYAAFVEGRMSASEVMEIYRERKA